MRILVVEDNPDILANLYGYLEPCGHTLDSAAEAAVHRNIHDIHVALNQAQFDALVSFTYNAGPDGSGQTYVLINKNDFKGAGASMQKLIKVRVQTKTGVKKVVAPRLIKRRAQESVPVMKPDAGVTTTSN